MNRGFIFAALAVGAGIGIYFVESRKSVSVGPDGRFSFADLVILAKNAGFDDSTTAAAIAMAESSGDPNAVGDLDITPGGSIGLWQINLHAHPEYSAEELSDPATNAKAAFAVYSASGSFQPWSTYNAGTYEKYLPSEEQAA